MSCRSHPPWIITSLPAQIRLALCKAWDMRIRTQVQKGDWQWIIMPVSGHKHLKSNTPLFASHLDQTRWKENKPSLHNNCVLNWLYIRALYYWTPTPAMRLPLPKSHLVSHPLSWFRLLAAATHPHQMLWNLCINKLESHRLGWTDRRKEGWTDKGCVRELGEQPASRKVSQFLWGHKVA
jgi:hypothetical protein